jgi:hypothetical protein
MNKKYALIIAAVGILAIVALYTRQSDRTDMTINQQEVCLEYIKENIENISPIDPVLGGNWYVTDMSFGSGNSIIVSYEDGHIAATAAIECLVISGKASIQGVQLISQ